MFETYTEAARRAVFIGLYEASQFGSESIEIEHLLLGFLRADLTLAFRLFKSSEKLEEVRDRVERETPRKNRTASSSVDLPLSNQSERVLNRAALEAGRRHQAYVGSEHLFWGIMQAKASIAARIMLESGISLSQIEEEVGKAKQGAEKPTLSSTTQLSAHTLPADAFPDLVAEAGDDGAAPVIGREGELERIIQILLRRTKNSAVLIGEPGVGKEAIVRGLAQRIALGHVPPELADRKILVVNVPEFAGAFTLPRSRWAAKNSFREKLPEFAQYGGPILYVRGLFGLRTTVPLLASYLKQGSCS
jgi:ATP-dependent Clp protease ATP-binding subunit ClpC